MNWRLPTGFAVTGLAMLALSARAPAQQAFISAEQRSADFTAFCDFVREQYAYFELKKTNWAATCASYAPRAAAAADRDAFIGVLERAMAEIYDHHAHLGTNTDKSPRLVPTQSQIFGSWRAGKALVVAVRDNSPAKSAGVRPGMQVLAVDGEPVETAVAALEPKLLTAPDAAAREWALQLALAGHRANDAIRLSINDGSGARDITFAPVNTDRPEALLSQKLLGDVGYIRFNNSLDEDALVQAFDDALAKFAQARAVVIDLRDTPSGGVSSVARGIMGRFVSTPMPYQRHELVAEFRDTGVRRIWVEYVAPRDPLFAQPVVVLAGHWTGSMGEGIAIGLNATRSAPVLGEPMAHLLGALGQIELPNSKIPVRVPAEKLFHVNGTPREAFVPCGVAAANTPADDAELDAAVKLAHELAAKKRPPDAPWKCGRTNQ
ncbi:MAG: S41 family peptidase [Pseudomonadota bacterium]